MSARGMAAERHIPVLRDRIVELLAPALAAPGSIYVDGTLGMGGHAEAILERCPEARVIGIDRDTEALALAAERLEPYAARTSFVHAVYDEVPEALSELGIDHMDAALFDLGVSSLQLDETERGFSYSQDAPLDMRMDQASGLIAADVLNTYAAEDLERVLREYGEERFARKIAGAVVRERETAPFTTSARLVELERGDAEVEQDAHRGALGVLREDGRDVVVDGVDALEAVTEAGEPLPREGERLLVAVEPDDARGGAGLEQRLGVAAHPERRVDEDRALVVEGRREEGNDPVQEDRDVGGTRHRPGSASPVGEQDEGSGDAHGGCCREGHQRRGLAGLLPHPDRLWVRLADRRDAHESRPSCRCGA